VLSPSSANLSPAGPDSPVKKSPSGKANHIGDRHELSMHRVMICDARCRDPWNGETQYPARCGRATLKSNSKRKKTTWAGRPAPDCVARWPVPEDWGMALWASCVCRTHRQQTKTWTSPACQHSLYEAPEGPHGAPWHYYWRGKSPDLQSFACNASHCSVRSMPEGGRPVWATSRRAASRETKLWTSPVTEKRKHGSFNSPRLRGGEREKGENTRPKRLV